MFAQCYFITVVTFKDPVLTEVQLFARHDHRSYINMEKIGKYSMQKQLKLQYER